MNEETGYGEIKKLAQDHITNLKLGTDSRTRVPIFYITASL